LGTKINRNYFKGGLLFIIIMPEEEPLYRDDGITIDYHPESHEDHLLTLSRDDPGLNYMIQRGILRELATTPRGEMAAKLDRSSPGLLERAAQLEISPDGLHVAICQAYHEEEERIKRDLFYSAPEDTSA
jgi:hypothetical protein